MTRDPHRRLHRALTVSAARHGLAVQVLHTLERPWSSATFTGFRLTIALAIPGDDPAAWLAALPEEELPVPGWLVADLAVPCAAASGATLEVLLLEADA